jgi:formylglycine-generating enzyme required for sulfatase activity
MKVLITVPLLLLSLQLSFSQVWKFKSPPGTIQVKDNFYVDETELRNVSYREYMYWVSKVFGPNSSEYKFSEPLYLRDTTKVNWFVTKTISYSYYFRNPKYNDFQLVAITYEQALAFCKWRSDRVYEQDLIDRKAIKTNYNQKKDHYFSIENVRKGVYKTDKPEVVKLCRIPNYRLPTAAEWELAASGALDLEKYPYGLENTEAIRKLKVGNDTIGLVSARESEIVKTNSYGVINMLGNVAEMVAEKGILKGGFWKTSFDNLQIKKEARFEKPRKLVGFSMCT